MLVKAFFVLGPVTALLGAWRSSTGLMAVGLAWFVLAFALAWHRRAGQAEVDARRAELGLREGEPAPSDEPMISHGRFLVGTALLLLVGVPAVVVGWSQWGIEDAEWRWLPLVVGGLVTLLALVSGLMFFLGAGITAVAGEVPTVPAVILIESMEQTGAYVNNQPRVEFGLEVRPDGQPPYRVTKRATVPLTALGGLRLGRGFHAMVAGPEDPTNMDIDWSAPFTPASDVDSLSDRMRELAELQQQGLISAEEYDAQRRRLLDSL